MEASCEQSVAVNTVSSSIFSTDIVTFTRRKFECDSAFKPIKIEQSSATRNCNWGKFVVSISL